MHGYRFRRRGYRTWMRRSGGVVVGKDLWSSNRGVEARCQPPALAALKRLAMLGWAAEAAVPAQPLIGGWAEDFANFAREILQGEGFLQKSFWRTGVRGGGDRVFSVAGEVEDLGGGACIEKLLNQLVTAQAGHDNVGDDEVDSVEDGVGECEGGGAVGGFKDAVAAGLERLADELANGFFVLDEEDGFRTSGGDQGNRSGAIAFGGLVDAREINGESCAATGFALHENISSTLFDDAVDGGKSKAGAFAFFFGGEERLEDASLSFAVHPLAGIGEGDHDIRTMFDERIFGVIGVVQNDAGGADADFAAVRHGIFSIDHEIHDDLFELSGIGAGAADGGLEVGGEFDILADQRAEEPLHVFDDGVDVNHFELQVLFAAEGEKLTS